MQSLTEEEMQNISAGERDWFKITSAGLMITACLVPGGGPVVAGVGIARGIIAIMDQM